MSILLIGVVYKIFVKMLKIFVIIEKCNKFKFLVQVDTCLPYLIDPKLFVVYICTHLFKG